MFNTYCSCGCGTQIADEKGLLLPAAKLADHFVLEADGTRDYIELYVRDHVIGREFCDGSGHVYKVTKEG